jgi:hypothetical protein
VLALTLLSLLTAVVALVLAVLAWRRPPAGGDQELPADVRADVLGLRQEVAALAAESGQTFRHLAVVRYDAFGDMGGHLSWSMALLDDAGDGVVLTSIHGRSDARTYAKSVSTWASDAQLSPEEEEAIASARPKR